MEELDTRLPRVYQRELMLQAKSPMLDTQKSKGVKKVIKTDMFILQKGRTDAACYKAEPTSMIIIDQPLLRVAWLLPSRCIYCQGRTQGGGGGWS